MMMNEVKVLLVEDKASIRATLKAMLQEMDIERIHESKDGIEALEYSDTNPTGVDIVVCDWNMPRKTGIEFLKEVRMAHPDLPFLMVTARADKESVITAKNSQVTGYICKPFSFDQLRSKVMSILYSPST